MEKYLLFIDTEASGLPVNWNLPYSAKDNWPHAVQVSWIIYDQEQNIVKKENYYIYSREFKIEQSAINIHGLTPQFLEKNGNELHRVLTLLSADLVQYQPIVIGHFTRLDYYILSAEFYRSNIYNPLNSLPVFCTMTASRDMLLNVSNRHLKLDELYKLLFEQDFQQPHNALNDAQATADCYFELQRIGVITPNTIIEQTLKFEKLRDPAKKPGGCMLPLLIVVVLLVILIICCYE